MTLEFEDINVDVVSARIAHALKKYAELDESESQEVSFHLTDWIGDLCKLGNLYKNIETCDDEQIYRTILGFVIHVPYHVIKAASLVTGETEQEIVFPTENKDTHQRK